MPGFFSSYCSSPRALMPLLLGVALPFAVRASNLEWKNGEKAGGGVIEANERTIRWQIDPKEQPFMEPVEIDLAVIRSYELKPDENKDWSKDEPTREPLSLRLDDGTRLFGEITAIDAKNVTVRAQRFGTVAVSRGAVTSIQRMNGEGVLLAGPGGRQGWKPDDNAKQQLWRHVPGGYVSEVGWNHRAQVEVKLPERVELRLRLRSSERPEFKIELGSEDGQRCIVETWDDEIVLQGRQFATLGTIAGDQRSITLGIFWDRKSGLCSLFDGSGKKLAETRMPAVEKEEKPQAAVPDNNAPPQVGGLAGAILGLMKIKAAAQQPAAVKSESAQVQGLALLNKGVDLTLEEMMMREWDGRLPESLSDAVPRVELADGRVLRGSITKAGAAHFTVKTDKGEVTLPWKLLLAAHHAAANVGGGWFTKPEASVSFADGMWVAGKMIALKRPKLTLQTTFSPQPVVLDVTGLMRIDFNVSVPEDAPKSQPLAKMDLMKLKGRSLHGTLEADGGLLPRWRLIGATKAVPVKLSGDMEIDRADANVQSARPGALFYLKSGDIVPGTLRAMDERRVDVESAIVSAAQFRPDELHAVQFAGESLVAEGFKDKSWRIVRGTKQQVRYADSHVEFDPGGSLGHPTFAQVNEILFRIENTGFSAMRLRLFTNGVDPGGKSLNLLFGHMGNEAVFGVESRGDQMDTQNRVAAPTSVPVRVVLKDKTVEVSINGVMVRQINLTPEMKGGSGVVIEPFSLWGNGERDVRLSHFEAKAGPGQLAMPAVDPKAREQALLVPRFRRESPPQHMLVAANGDLLRGVVEAATQTTFAVRSGLETVQVPANRVSALVWLQKPAEDKKEKDAPPAATPDDGKTEPAAAPAAPSHFLLLGNGGRFGLNVTRFDKDAVIGTEPRLGEVRVPLNEVNVIRTTAPEENVLLRSFREWRLAYMQEPVLPEKGGESSPVLDKDAPVFSLPLLGGGEFDLTKEKGKVVVLDFWATWCGPCVKSLPDLIAKMGEFDAKKVRFITVNQAEPSAQVKSFLDTRGWKMEVVLDAFQRIGQQYGVEGIPHTVVISPEGKVAFVKTGYSPDGAEKIAEAVQKLLK